MDITAFFKDLMDIEAYLNNYPDRTETSVWKMFEKNGYLNIGAKTSKTVTSKAE